MSNTMTITRGRAVVVLVVIANVLHMLRRFGEWSLEYYAVCLSYLDLRGKKKDSETMHTTYPRRNDINCSGCSQIGSETLILRVDVYHGSDRHTNPS